MFISADVIKILMFGSNTHIRTRWPLTGNRDNGVLLTGVALVTGVVIGELRGKLVGGRGVVMEVVGEDVPGAAGSVALASAGPEGGPAPMSIKSERSFLSRAWMSSMPGVLL